MKTLYEHEESGTFSFCTHCPASNNCCTKNKQEGRIGTPVLFLNEIKHIETYTNESADNFSRVDSRITPIPRIMKSGTQGCHFYKSGKCSIYPVRPFDCKLFPYDILRKPNGVLVLIAYIKFCPQNFDPQANVQRVLELLSKSEVDINAYAQLKIPNQSEEYVELLELKNLVESKVSFDEAILPHGDL